MKRNHIGQVVLGLILILVGTSSMGATVYVDDDAPPGGDGNSWATAYQHLQDALVPLKTHVSVEATLICVAQGIYRPDRGAACPQGTGDRLAVFELTDHVQLRGGFAGVGASDPYQRDIGRFRTVFSGDLAANDVEVRDVRWLEDEPTRADNSRHIVAATGSAVLEGVIITGGHASPCDQAPGTADPFAGAGGGMLVTNLSRIDNCVFKGNFAAEQGGAIYGDVRAAVALNGCTLEGNAAGRGATLERGSGGAVMLLGSWINSENCVFTGNMAVRGAGICVVDSPEVGLTRCLFAGNVALESGAALHNQNSPLRLSHGVFTWNKAARGGSIYMVDSPEVGLTHCLFAGNVALKSGAALHNQNTWLWLSNCTGTGNRAPTGRFLSDDTSRPARGKEATPVQVRNCILANDGNEISNAYGALAVQFTDVVGGRSAISDPRGTMVWGPGNIDADPCFADAGFWDSRDTPGDPNDDVFVAGDYHLKSRAGRWEPATRAWAQDDVSSPCIDGGDPVLYFGAEPVPNGSRVNMGYYGATAEASKSEYTWHLVTTQGPLLAEGLGVVLPHEHIFTDLRGPTVAGYGQADPADVVRVMKPWLSGARQAGVGVLVECTSIGVGRNVTIVDRVAREAGLPVVVPTGVYGRDNFAPPEHRNMTEDELANLFIREIREGIEGTGINAGFIKIATGSGAMTPLEEKFLRAAGRAARETGAAIASHTPVSSNASLQAGILASIDPSIRLIWVHASSENNRAVQRQLAGRGVYIEFDSVGANPGQDAGLIGAIQELLAAGYGDRILLSHDAGYYQPGQVNGGTQRGFTYLMDTFIPKLSAAGVDEATIRMITEINPIRALGFKSSLYESKETQGESSPL